MAKLHVKIVHYKDKCHDENELYIQNIDTILESTVNTTRRAYTHFAPFCDSICISETCFFLASLADFQMLTVNPMLETWSWKCSQ